LPGFIPLTAPQEVELSEEEIGTIVNFLAANPESWRRDCGHRKFRRAGRGKGKSGFYRTITFYSGEMMPVFLVTARNPI